MLDKKYICHSSLRERGWTDKMITDYGLEPDKIVRNPYYHCAGDMRLYLTDRIETIEQSDWFKERYTQSRERSEAASKAAIMVAQRKRKETIELADSLEIRIPDWSKEQMFRTAINHYNDLWNYRGKDKHIGDYRNLDEETLERLTCNYVRHCLTDYEDVLSELAGRVGVSVAHDMLQERINTRVHEKFFTS